MKKLKLLGIGLVLSILISSNMYAGKIKNFLLDSSRPFVIKVSNVQGGKTTVMFPGTLGALHGSNITQKAGENAGFVITADKGSYFFSLESQDPEAVGSINAVYNRQIIVLRIENAPENESYSSVTFKNINQVISGGNGGMGSITPTVVRDLIEKAQLYTVLINKYPESYENVEYARKEQLFNYTGYSILLENVYRFKMDDTVVFQLLLRNNTDKTLVYDPHLLVAATGSRRIYSSVTVGSGQIPSHGETPVWFAITGNLSGGRNELAADSNWKILLTAGKIDQKVSTLDINKKIIARENDLQDQISQINKRLNSNSVSNKEIELLITKVEIINTELVKLQSQRSVIQ